MLSIDDLQTLRAAYGARDDALVAEALRRMGAPSFETLVDSAVARISHADRNARVLALRILTRQRGEKAMRGVLAGLNDDARRVCSVAIQACPNYLESDEIAQSLEAIARDSGRTRKLRYRALAMLSGDDGRLRGDLTPPVACALSRLLAEDEYRFTIAFGLARLELGPRIELLLREVARSGDERERALARRALKGERVIHIDAYTSDEALHQGIRETCRIAHGRMFYWIPREGFPALSLP